MERLLPFYVTGAKRELTMAFVASFANAIVLFMFAAAITLGVKVVL